jgi:ABC-2 type transport system ATP-binding protein
VDDVNMPGTGSAPTLEIRGLGKSFGATVVLESIDLRLRCGTLSVVSGDNGSGKSTLLECLAGAQPFDTGEILLGGRSTATTDRGYWRSVYGILDDFAWFPELSVLDHLRLLEPSLTRADALTTLARLGAEPLVDRLPMTLSSGQRQRCSLASAAVRPWEVLLVDEPERHLDRDTMPAVATFLAELTERGAVLAASHDDVLTTHQLARQHHLNHCHLVVPG